MLTSSKNAAFIAGAGFILSVCALIIYLTECFVANQDPNHYYLFLILSGLFLVVVFEQIRRKAQIREAREDYERKAQLARRDAKFEEWKKEVREKELRFTYGKN